VVPERLTLPPQESKWYLRDWSGIDDSEARAEIFVACHLLKAVQVWEDLGLGSFTLHYLRDKDRREVDFLVVTRAPHAFQVVIDADFVAADPFKRRDSCIIPARTLVSQLP
jgi:uncharacterized protein